MAKKNRQDQVKHGQWTRELARWRRSGETVRAFCQRRGLSEPSFYYWRRRLEPEQQPEPATGASLLNKASPPFAEVRLTDQQAESTQVLELLLPTGERLRIGEGVSDEQLRRVLTAVREVLGC